MAEDPRDPTTSRARHRRRLIVSLDAHMTERRGLRAIDRGFVTVAAALLLAACGRSASIARAPVAPTLHTAPPVSLAGVHVSVLSDEALAPRLSQAIATTVKAHHGLLVTPTTVPTADLPLAALTTRADAYLFAIRPSPAIEAQLGGVLSLPVGRETLSIGVDLPASPTLTTDQLDAMLTGSIKHWNSPALGRQAMSADLPVTVSTNVHEPVIMGILSHALGLTEATLAVPTTSACTTTPGCLDLSLATPAGKPVALIANGTATLPGDHDYPLAVDEVLELTESPLHPRTEYAGLVLADSLLATSNLPATTVTSEEHAIAAREASLAIDVLAGEGR